jgi:predicted site-specific integrase-resolvase
MLQTIGGTTGSRSNTDDTNSLKNISIKMDKGLKIWQAFLATLSMFLTIVGAVILFTNKVETQRLRLDYLESTQKDQGLQIKDVNQRNEQQYKEINDKLTDILIMMQNKENKK